MPYCRPLDKGLSVPCRHACALSARVPLSVGPTVSCHQEESLLFLPVRAWLSVLSAAKALEISLHLSTVLGHVLSPPALAFHWLISQRCCRISPLLLGCSHNPLHAGCLGGNTHKESRGHKNKAQAAQAHDTDTELIRTNTGAAHSMAKRQGNLQRLAALQPQQLAVTVSWHPSGSPFG